MMAPQHVPFESSQSTPSLWPSVTLRRIASVVTVRAQEKTLELGLEDIESWTGRLIQHESTYEAVGIAFEKDDVLFGKLRPYLAKVYQAETSGQAVGDFIVLRPGQRMYPRFLTYNLLAQPLIERLTASAYGSKMPRTNWGELGSQPIMLPPLEEQQQIAAFLDYETARIDELVQEQVHLEELLQEKRRAQIKSLVTRGVLYSGQLKESKIDWIPQIPVHWRNFKLSWAFRVIGSGMTPPASDARWYGGETPWVTTSELREGTVSDTRKHVTDDALQEFSALRQYPPGSIALAMYGATIGRVGLLGVTATVNQACCVLAQPITLDNEFVFFWLQAFRSEITRLGVGGGQPNISQEIVASLRIPAPPLKEQREIVKRLKEVVARIEQLQETTRTSISLLLERRSALITAAVTGQIGVRDWRPPEPEEEELQGVV